MSMLEMARGNEVIGSQQAVRPESVTSVGKALVPPCCNAWMCKKPGNGILARLALPVPKESR